MKANKQKKYHSLEDVFKFEISEHMAGLLEVEGEMLVKLGDNYYKIIKEREDAYERGVVHGKLQEQLLREKPIPETYISDSVEEKIISIIESMTFPKYDPVLLQAVGDLKFLVKANKYLSQTKGGKE